MSTNIFPFCICFLGPIVLWEEITLEQKNPNILESYKLISSIIKFIQIYYLNSINYNYFPTEEHIRTIDGQVQGNFCCTYLPSCQTLLGFLILVAHISSLFGYADNGSFFFNSDIWSLKRWCLEVSKKIHVKCYLMMEIEGMKLTIKLALLLVPL